MRTLFKNIRWGQSTLLQSSAVTVVAVLAVLGLGAHSSISNGVSRYFHDASDAAIIWKACRISNPVVVPHANHSNWKSRNRVFGDIAADVDLARVSLTGAGEPEELLAGEVTANFFQMIGVHPVLGRSFSKEEDQRGHHHVAILSHALWRRHFAGAASVIGKNIMLNGAFHQVIGILPRDFSWNNRRTDVWVPYLFDSNGDERIAGARYMGAAAPLNQNGRTRSGEI